MFYLEKELSNSLQPHGILQARILEWIVFPFSRGSSQPRDWTQVSHIAGGFFTSWATREAQEYWLPLNTCKKKKSADYIFAGLYFQFSSNNQYVFPFPNTVCF